MPNLEEEFPLKEVPMAVVITIKVQVNISPTQILMGQQWPWNRNHTKKSQQLPQLHPQTISLSKTGQFCLQH